SAQIREILISESAWEEMTCLFAPSLEEGGISEANNEQSGYSDITRQLQLALIIPAVLLEYTLFMF
ncbi:hypothetical protein RZP54_29645, partial [Raoultella ornithinolytica]|nr:hypothetical protein [Raoultella ornithinolytica]